MDDWRPIPGHEFYEANSRGEIRSKDRTTTDGRRIRGRVLKPFQMPSGYWQVSVSQFEKRYAHRLICAAFNGSPLDGLEVAHLDGDRSNNRPSNLMWVTHAENEQQKKLHGTYARPRVFKQPHHKKRGPTPARHPEADTILTMRGDGATIAQIANYLGMSKSGAAGVLKSRC